MHTVNLVPKINPKPAKTHFTKNELDHAIYTVVERKKVTIWPNYNKILTSA